ncbi:aminotransferase family protein [Rhizobium terrae]|uniref:aminotransferase family protein n=1 Tax=Rhizobium terrae TaxID=2171756 RepID=UPI000E3DE1D2|nr:aminotransferase [Rhizobium terrae]
MDGLSGIPAESGNMSLVDRDREAFFHPFTSIKDQKTNGAIVMTAAEGCRIRDASGSEYLDGAAGLWCVNVGYGRTEIADAIHAQSKALPYFHTFNTMANDPVVRLSERLLGLAPANMKRVFYGSSGSDANDTAVKMLWSYNICRGKPEKKKIISRAYAYHGVSVASGSLTGVPMVHQYFGLPLEFARHVSRPDLYRDAPARGFSSQEAYSSFLARELEEMILAEGPETVAGFVAEPVMGTGGVLPPPRGYFQEIKRVLDRYDIRMVADEVITGFGRLGQWFACDSYGIEPDLILAAKGLTSGYLPLSAVIVGEKIWRVFEAASDDGRAFAHGFTYSGHPACAAAAMANLDIIERENLVQRVAEIAPDFRSIFTGKLLDLDIVGDIRTAGLMMGIELVANKGEKRAFPAAAKIAGRVSLAARRHGLLLRALPNSDVLALSPPFTVSHKDMEMIAERARAAIVGITAELRQEALL